MAAQKRLNKRQRDQKQREASSTPALSLKAIRPITEKQADLTDAYNDGRKVILAIGTAGTGKTYLSMALALKDVIGNPNSPIDRVVVVRTSAQTRDQGFMPGTLTEKMSYFETPYVDIVNDLLEDRGAWSFLKSNRSIEFMSTSFIRGLTIDNAVIIFDEVQNANYAEIRSCLTRLGANSRIILCGDTKQDDLKQGKNRNDVSGLVEFLKVASKMEDVRTVHFGVNDIVRSGVVKDFILAEEACYHMA